MSKRHKDLLDAWAIPNARNRRQALRKLAASNLARHGSAIIDALAVSPLVGDGERQIAMPHKTAAGLRDLLDPQTLLAVAYADKWVEHVCNALRNPTHFGMESKSGKTGFVFGRPRDLTDGMIGKIVDAIKGAAEEGEDDMGLASTLATYDKLCKYFVGVGASVVVEALATAMVSLDTSREFNAVRDGLTAALKARGDAATDHVASEVLFDLARKVLIENGWHESFAPDDHGLPTPVPASELRVPGGSEAGLIDLALRSASLPDIATLIDRANRAGALTAKVDELEARLKASAVVAPVAAVHVASSTLGVPGGKLALKKAWEAFGLTKGKETFDFNVPCWDWEHEHPHVPAVDPDYIFRPFELLRVLWALNTNEKSWLYGHTGTGKSTLIEQVCARLNYPMLRVNFDSEISRLDLVGREVLRQEEGATVSEFIEGILPMAMNGPYVICLDEIDYVRPDVAYVLQRGLEDKGLLLTEDGGRLVRPHSMFRIFATGNTQGQGDEYGMYAGARVQSMAFLDRFTNWIRVDYLTATEREKLIAAKVPTLDPDLRKTLVAYSTEHLAAFTGGKVMLPLSPRGVLAAAKALAAFTTMMAPGLKSKAVSEALGAVILDRATPQDRAVLAGIVDRVFK
jgi:cobaltochelatase CobS subunit